MNIPSTINRVVMTRRYAAPRDRVFRVWTEPEHLKRWFFAAETETIADAEVDLRVGGLYRVSLYAAAGELIYTIGGRYQAVEPPAKLAFSWRWEIPHLDEAETLVTVTFHEIKAGQHPSQGTEVVIKHDLLPDQNPCWDNRLDRLGQLFDK